MEVIIDLEADNLLDDITQAWCIVCKEIESNNIVLFVPQEHVGEVSPSVKDKVTEVQSLASFRDYSKKITHWIGHNIINYDARALEKLGLCPKIPVTRMTDTMVLSQITKPNRLGGHSLRAWGERFDFPKDVWEDFSKFDWEMVSYCIQDIAVTEKLYQHMQKNTTEFSKFSIRLEHQMRHIMDGMQENGFWFDQERAHKIYTEIKRECDLLENQIYDKFPPKKFYYKRLYPRYTSKGEMHGQDARTLEKASYDKQTDEEGNTFYHLYHMKSFNLRSPIQIVERMDELGWEPVVLNEPSAKRITEGLSEGLDEGDIKGSPKVCEENFETLPESAPLEAHLIAKWFLLDKRLQKLDEWFRELNPLTGCIHGKVFPCGAHTHRMTHRNPNMANISKIASKKKKLDTEASLDEFLSRLGAHDALEVKRDSKEVEYRVWGAEGKYSTDMRACFGCRDTKTRKLVGVDLSGIQLRGFAHYANNQEYINQILLGDIHTHNATILKTLAEEFCKVRKLPVETTTFLTKNDKGRRNNAKTFIYGYLFGAGSKKVGSILEFPEHLQMPAGKFIKDGFAKAIEGLEDFRQNIKLWVKRGFMEGLDGRLISLPSEHLGLAIALQSFEAIVMKYSILLSIREIEKRGLDALLVGVIHDETQWDVRADQAEEVGTLVVECMEEAGRYFKTRIPLTGEFNIGSTWADSH